MGTTTETTTMRVTAESAQTLRQLSELSKLSIQDLIKEWAKALQAVIDKFGPCDRVSVYSHSYEKSTEYEGLVLTRLGKLVMTSFPLEHFASDKEAEKKAKVKANEF